jgi:hypothetical protein
LRHQAALLDGLWHEAHHLRGRNANRSLTTNLEALNMLKKLLLSMAMLGSMALSQVSFAGDAAKDECQGDKDCKDGKVCILALTPHVCKAPQAAGAVCKRDAVCISKKCDIAAGKDVGVCK